MPGGEKQTITFDSAGDSSVSEVITVNLTLKNAAGATVTSVSNAQPVTINAQLTSSLGTSQNNKLVTFTLNNSSLASFSNGTGTASTDANGLATLGLVVGSVSGSGQLTATLSTGQTAAVVFDSAGDKPTENYNLQLSLVDTTGSDSIALSKTEPLKLIGVLTSPKGLSVKNKLVSFAVSDPALAELGVANGTALTNADGVVEMALTVGTKSGSGAVSATVNSQLLATENFTSAGNKTASDLLTLTMTLKDLTGLETSSVSKDKPLNVSVQVASKLGVNQAGKLVTFSLNDGELGFFNNAAGTAETDANGVARITLNTGTKSGAGIISASISEPSALTVTKTFTSAGDGGVVDSKPVGSIVLYADKLALGTGVSDKVALTALVRDKNNVLLKDVKVQFTADNDGVLQVESDITGVDGLAKAYLSTKANYNLRDITVTAIAGTNALTDSQVIAVTGNTLNIEGSSSIALKGEMELSFTLLDSEGRGIPDTVLTLTSSLGNTFSNASPRTGLLTGQVKVKYTANNAPIDEKFDVVAVSALGVNGSKRIEINPDEFTFNSSPEANVEIELNTAHSESITWKSKSIPQVNRDVRFISTRGEVAATGTSFDNKAVLNTVTDNTGVATVFMRSNQSGFALISAESIGVSPAISTSRIVEFIAKDAQKVEVQVVPAQIAAGDSAIVQAIVRNSGNNPVKGQTIAFSITGGFGGSLSPVTAVTNSQGVATTTFTADTISPGSGTPDNQTGLNVKAALVTNEAISGTGAVSVGQRTLFFRFGTGNTVDKKEQSLYSKQFAVIVTDASGNSVPNQQLTVAVYPKRYAKGLWARYPIVGTFKYWIPIRSTAYLQDKSRTDLADLSDDCSSEDFNRNGILDDAEDKNHDQQLTPGNVVAVERSVTANGEGIALFNLVYPIEYSPWVDVDIVVRGSARGTENEASRSYTLAYSADDTDDETVQPPANPWGVKASVFDATTNTFVTVNPKDDAAEKTGDLCTIDLP